MQEKDLIFVAGVFFDCDIPKEYRYLLKYFCSNLQVAFLRYILTFGEYRLFCQHTGYHCSYRMLKRLFRRYRVLTEAHEKVKGDLSEAAMKELWLLESGQYSVDNIC
jgi:hypothetical protein